MCKWGAKLSRIEGSRRAVTIKYLSLSFVVVFLLHGIITVAVSIWLEVSNVKECDFLTNVPYWLAVHIQLSSGCLTIIICVSSLAYTITQRANGFIRIFSCLLVIVIILEIVSAIVAGVMIVKSGDHLKQGMLSSLNSINRTDRHSRGAVKCWTQLQKQYKCCGLDDYTIWRETYNSSAQSISKVWTSCDCQTEDECEPINGQKKYSSGCYTKLKDKIYFVLTFTRFFGPTFAVVQMFAYIAIQIMFSKLYKHSVVAAYTAKDRAGQTPSDSCQVDVATVS